MTAPEKCTSCSGIPALPHEVPDECCQRCMGRGIVTEQQNDRRNAPTFDQEIDVTVVDGNIEIGIPIQISGGKVRLRLHPLGAMTLSQRLDWACRETGLVWGGDDAR